jgi:hypothetical protein
MAFENQSECAVRECGRPCSAWSNLCERHKVDGVVVENGAGSGVVTLWYAVHDNQFGLILLSDWALGSYFGGAEGFEARLIRQGFKNVRNMMTPEKFEFASLYACKGAGNWSGAWSTKYPWENPKD